MDISDPTYLQRSARYYRARAASEAEPCRALLMRQLAGAFEKEALGRAASLPIAAKIDTQRVRHRERHDSPNLRLVVSRL